jgi:2-C-methyl-D-erythritol 4-phosphate cytidylyltransferase/2-C-methyl-D-erythritol 2,4-cyclodiphosphate synthase
VPGVERNGDVWCIVVAAGSGRRFGGAKQFGLLAGRRVVDRSVEVAAGCCDGVVVVLPAAAIGTADAVVPGASAVVPGGTTRAESVRAGLAAVPDGAAVVLVHDAARPLATPSLYGRVVAAVRDGAAAVVPAVPVVDTVRSVGTGGVVDRELLRAVQTPQGFPADGLRAAHAAGGEATDDASLVESAGGRVELVEGERTNLKLTGPEDLVVAEALLDARLLDVAEPEPAPGPAIRIGNGFDVHRFSDDADRPLVLGGVRFEGEGPGLHGHSDADVVAHAVAEALLGSAGLGDLGSHFPDTDDRWRGADSMALLAEVVRMLAAEGWRAVNVDCSVVAERPKLARRRDEMQAALAAVVGAPVTVKGRRAEGIGGLGRAEGIACFASALVTSTGSGS